MNSPRMRRFGKLLLVVFALACVLTTAAFAEGDAEVVSAVHGTIASLLPPVVAIGLALNIALIIVLKSGWLKRKAARMEKAHEH